MIAARCATCPSATGAAPFGIKFEIEAWAGAIEQQAVITRRMPPGNATDITDDERELLGAWIASR